jgi:hypothetical protein
MDNNYYNNMNQNQNQSTQNNQNGYNPYNSNSQGQTYQNTSYNAYNPYQQPTGGPAPRKPRRRSGFGATIGKCAAVHSIRQSMVFHLPDTFVPPVVSDPFWISSVPVAPTVSL